MAKTPWKTLSVVVSVPVLEQGGFSYTAKDLTYSIQRAVDADGFWQDQKYLPAKSRPRFGRVRVAQLSRWLAAKRKTL